MIISRTSQHFSTASELWEGSCHSVVLWLLLSACSYVIDLSKGNYMICVCVCVRACVGFYVTVGQPDDRSEG